ncbi:MAG: ribosome silencing factor [Firmicutes bacterium]|uniref:Ribosomal silencing factor RsfS n=1 Tax=Candidatus Scybalomonas excrementavium TaxID=2840943 RepID=A0A9D9N8C6_9FIRM|nr:ribosome silencing factor [Candidatus Scybalomonas excrementavium]
MENRAKQMASIAVKAIDDKLGKDIKVIDISNISIVADYFIIASGANKNQVQAIVDNVEDELAKAGHHPKQVEGYQTANWILLDYGDIILHIFDEENRLFYDIERIWRDGQDVDIKDFLDDK